jgi:hypothetical protein
LAIRRYTVYIQDRDFGFWIRQISDFQFLVLGGGAPGGIVECDLNATKKISKPHENIDFFDKIATFLIKSATKRNTCTL